MADLTWPPKDPDEVLDYQVTWATKLAGDTILTSTWIISPDAVLVKNSDTFTTGTTTIWLQGGTLGKTYELTNRVHTVGGRTMDQTVELTISTK